MNYQDLSIKLIQEQYKLKNSKSKSILVIIGGIELTRKNQSIKKLSELMDPRYLKIKAETPNRVKENKLIWQPYINDIPKNGQIMFFYGNWYTDLLASTILNDEKIQNNVFNEHLKRIYEFESYLKNNNVDIIKVWFEVSWSKVKIRTKNIDIIENQKDLLSETVSQPNSKNDPGFRQRYNEVKKQISEYNNQINLLK